MITLFTWDLLDPDAWEKVGPEKLAKWKETLLKTHRGKCDPLDYKLIKVNWKDLDKTIIDEAWKEWVFSSQNCGSVATAPAPIKPPIEQISEALGLKAPTVECYVGYRELREENLSPDRHPTTIGVASSREEAFTMMLRLAGLDDAEAEALGLTYADMDDFHEFCKRLEEACGDAFELVTYDKVEEA